MIKVSLIMLTMSRKEAVKKSLDSNIELAGYPIEELIHVDNGSESGFAEWFKNRYRPDVQVIHQGNLGVAKGYNRGMLLATGTHVVITGCDRVMPKDWLKIFVDCFEKIPQTGVISHYSHPTEASRSGKLIDRFRTPPVEINGIKITEALVAEARMHSREFLLKTGFFREDFGIYGYEDCEWADRAHRVACDNSLINYVISDLPLADHLCDDDALPMRGGQIYRAFKDSHNGTDWQRSLVERCWKARNPYYNPYSRVEKYGEVEMPPIMEGEEHVTDGTEKQI